METTAKYRIAGISINTSNTLFFYLWFLTIPLQLKYFAAIVFLILLCPEADGQYRFTLFDSYKGLSNGSVHCMYQDSDGYLWIGTQDGLNCFDGYNFTVFRNRENDSLSLSDSFILSITEDSSGNLWIGARNGLNCLNRKTGLVKRYYEAEGEKHIFQNSYTSLVTGKDKRIWFEHLGHVIYFNPATDKLVKLEIPLNPVAMPVADREGNIWICTLSGRIFRVGDDLSLTRYEFQTDFKTDIRTSSIACINSKGILYLASGNEIVLFDTQTGKRLEGKIDLPNIIQNMSGDSKGNVWVSSSEGLYSVDGFKFEFITNDESDHRSIPPGAVLCSYEDRDGNLWVGTGTVGVSVYQPAQAAFKLLRSSIYNDAVSSAFQDNRGVLWIGTSSALFRYLLKNPSRTSAEDIENNIAHVYKIELVPGKRTKVISLTGDGGGKIWAGTSGNGIFILDEGGRVRGHILKTPGGLPDNTVFYLRKDKSGMIWASTENGQARSDPTTKQWMIFRKGGEREICGNYVISSYADSKGNTWICTSEGLDVYDASLKRIKSFSSTADTSSALRRTIITSCTEDPDNNMWIATLSKGIYEFRNDGKIIHYDMGNALESNVIYAIQSDLRGRVWASNSAGISVFDPREKRFFNLSAGDGLPYSSYSMVGYHRNKAGDLFWCTPEGLVIFNPEDIVRKKKRVKPKISSLEVNYKIVATDPKKLDLYRGDMVLKIGFVAIELIHADKQIYQYRMKGFDEKWITAGEGIRSATYTNLPFGKYTFEVRASADRFDLPEAKIASIMIIRHPPFWMKLWFIALSVLLFSFFAILTVKYFSQRKLKKQLQEIRLSEKIHSERERISRDLHDNVGSQITYIISSLDNIAYSEMEDPEKPAKKNIEALSDFARSTMQQLRETIWTLNKDTIPVFEIKNKIHGYTERIVSGIEGITLNFSFGEESSSTLNSIQSINLFRIVQEAVNNCIKHANTTVLEIKMYETDDKKLMVEINDNGKGFSGGTENEQEQYGISNMHNRALEMNGTLTLTSQPGIGTSVKLSLPL